MKTVSAAVANREFSRILREVANGETVIVTSRGKPVAEIAQPKNVEAEEMARKLAMTRLLERLASQPARNLGKFRREDAYDD